MDLSRHQLRAGRIDFRFDDFAGPGGQDFSNISYIILVFPTGGALTLESIETRRRLPLDQALLRWHPTTPETAKLAVHAGLVRPGRIVFFRGDEHDPGRHFLGRTDLAQIDSTRVYDCTTGAIERIPSPEVAAGQPPADLFCCGHAQLADGRLLVAGGTGGSRATALDALARPGTTACTVCDAAEALLPILAHGQGDVPGHGD
ncbi:hypothetical protein [Streptomyces avidinii]|uniref:Uncharacterized protein n=1 Tax=Streptomyces avidinii TaxID=1895 RepID=A0ABS4L6U3_STRAV|nr:hypothetical protein [Streptomyces avidinii]MBP2037825.1 hypothetical protein [Streptomyces avidinii]GGZ08407.1 hypothetical protein GCM10010343_38320 [Streptomyces avidinii]